jgi:hypothetical protein
MVCADPDWRGAPCGRMNTQVRKMQFHIKKNDLDAAPQNFSIRDIESHDSK